MSTRIRASSGHIFRELDFPPGDAEDLRIRSTLMAAVRRHIDERGLRHPEAAKLFGVTQRQIGDLARGKIDLFSVDSLLDILARAGVHVDVAVSDGQN